MSKKIENGPEVSTIGLERWLGRREALGMIAGRCSAADVECLRQIRDNKLYLEEESSWEEFCDRRLGCSRRNVDRAIRHLNQHGPAFFHATQMLRITEAEYLAMKEYITEDGLKLETGIVPWAPENTARLHEAACKLKAIAAPKPVKAPPSFDTLMQRYGALNALLAEAPHVLSPNERAALGDTLLRLADLASVRGVTLRCG